MTTEVDGSGPGLAALLAPIGAERPAGESLRYDGLYDRIREARREEDPNASLGIWTHALKAADWQLVEKLCVEALTERTKDLQIAAWLLEAWTRQRGFAGTADGMQLLLQLCEKYWDNAYPLIDPDDPDFRAAPFHWINEKLLTVIHSVPVSAPAAENTQAYRWVDWQRVLWLQKMPPASANAKNAKEKVAPQPVLTLEMFSTSIAQTPVDFFDLRVRELRDALQHTAALQTLLDEKMGSDAPSLIRFRDALASIAEWMIAVLTERRNVPAAKVAEEAPAPASAAKAAPASRAQQPPVAGAAAIGAIDSRDAAYRALEEAALYLLKSEPHSPTPYMVRRAVAWGGMTLPQLIEEAEEHGLDVRALFTFLGITES